jgi:hypothetical protein
VTGLYELLGNPTTKLIEPPGPFPLPLSNRKYNTVVIADVLHFDEQVFLYISVIFIILCAKILSRVENIVHDMFK